MRVFTVFSLNQRQAVVDAKGAVATILLLKTYRKWFSWYHLPCSFKIFLNVFAFKYVKGKMILRKSVKKYPFFLFSEK